MRVKIFTAFLFLLPSLTQANPVAVYVPWNWKSVAPLIQEDLTIEIYEKFSRIEGKFKFGPAGKKIDGDNLKLPIMLSEGKDIYSNFLNYNKIFGKCGDKGLWLNGGNADELFTHWLQNELKTKEVSVHDVQFGMGGCSPDATITIAYEQKNFPIDGKRMMVYLPILPGIHHREDRFKITLINKTNYNLEIRAPKEYASQNVNEPIEIHPLHKELITAFLTVPAASLSEPIPEDTPRSVDRAYHKAPTIDDVIHFGKRSSQIPPDNFLTLDKVFDEWKAYADTWKFFAHIKIKIEGHCDAQEAMGKFSIQLSEKRAQAAKKYLVSKGIPEENVSIVGYGSIRPIATNTTQEGQAKNRRVEFDVTIDYVNTIDGK